MKKKFNKEYILNIFEFLYHFLHEDTYNNNKNIILQKYR